MVDERCKKLKYNFVQVIKIEVLPSEGYLTESETADGSKKIEELISDFLIKIGLQRLPLRFLTDRM